MTIRNMQITRHSDDDYDFIYTKIMGVRIRSMDEERVEIVRFIDDAVDVIMRLKNRITSMPGVANLPNRVLFESGKSLATEIDNA